MIRRHEYAHDILMAYRYLYYIQGWSKITDFQYDKLETQFKEMYPDSTITTTAGADKEEGYTSHQITIAKMFMLEHMLLQGTLLTDDKNWADTFH